MKNLIKYFGILLCLITVIIQAIGALGFEVELYSLYANGVYKYLRLIYDHTLGMSPIPFIYILVMILMIYLFKSCIRYYNCNKIFGTKIALKQFGVGVLNFFGVVYFLFYFSWAFNYYRPSIESQLSFPEVNVDSVILLAEFREITVLMEKERSLISRDAIALKIEKDWSFLEDTIRDLQIGLLKGWGDKPAGRVRIRALRPKGVLLSISTAGVYIPFAFEGHVDAGLHVLQWPFTLAHEMAHGYGYTDEGVCNFIGLMTCMKSRDAYIRYSALLTYWKYLFFEIKNRYPELSTLKFDELSRGVKSDLLAIRAEHDQYPDIFPAARDFIYDFYLKFHGVSNGLDSYSEIILQVQRWKRSDYFFSFER